MKILVAITLLLVLVSCNEIKTSSNQNVKMNTMKDKSFTTTITVDKDLTSTFNSITNFRGWWSEDIEGKV